MNIPETICRVCGYQYPIDNPTWEDEETPSHDICICCGNQFGYNDADVEQVREYRAYWISAGAKWFGSTPQKIDIEQQFKNIPTKWQ